MKFQCTNNQDVEELLTNNEKEDENLAKRIKLLNEQFMNVPRKYIYGTFVSKTVPAEIDEQGTFYGYKVLEFHPQGLFYSPVYKTYWNRDGTLQADAVPTEENSHGIYFMKTVDDREIEDYYSQVTCRVYQKNHDYRYMDIHYRESMFIKVFVVKCALSDTIIEGERGFRASHARILGVLDNGHWNSYEETQERARYNTRQDRHRWEENPYPPRYYYPKPDDPTNTST